jgi:hypothetical protein
MQYGFLARLNEKLREGDSPLFLQRIDGEKAIRIDAQYRLMQ